MQGRKWRKAEKHPAVAEVGSPCAAAQGLINELPRTSSRARTGLPGAQ